LPKKKRAIFIGSGPSCGIGLPSVNELCKQAMGTNFLGQYPNATLDNSATDEAITLQDTIKRTFIYFFNRATLDQINFEEALTVLDEAGIGPEISGISRGNLSGRTEYHFGLTELKNQLLLAGMRVLWNKIYSLREAANNNEDAGRAFKTWKNAYAKINVSSSEYDDVLITTNYDVIIENALLRRYFYSNFISERTLILKLHGSMNWYKLEPEVFLDGELESGKNVRLDYRDEEVLDYVDDSRIVAIFPLEELFNSKPIIITPQISKNYSIPLFKRIWWLATKVLHDVEELVILGYSFSSNDFYVKKLIEIAINETVDSKITKIIHFDRDKNIHELFEGNPDKKIVPIIRKPGVKYIPRIIDFSKQCPNFEEIEGPYLQI
jgi:hypothetical protein